MGQPVRVLVTGASGHLGGVVARHLVACGHEVVGLSRSCRNAAGLSAAVAIDLGRPDAAATVASGQRRCDAIVHAAASLVLDRHSPSISLTNGLGTQQVLELAARWRVESVVFLSGVGVIGRPIELPITEQHRVQPLSAYHASKLYGEQLVRLAGEDGMAALSLRVSAPIGPGMSSDRILPTFVARALAGQPLRLAGRGTRGQDYVDARDVARAVQFGIERGARGLMNVASGRCITNRELAQVCVEVLGSNAEIAFSGEPDPEDELRWEVSIAAAQRELGYEPLYSLEQSILALAALPGSAATPELPGSAATRAAPFGSAATTR